MARYYYYHYYYNCCYYCCCYYYYCYYYCCYYCCCYYYLLTYLLTYLQVLLDRRAQHATLRSFLVAPGGHMVPRARHQPHLGVRLQGW